MSHFAGSGVVVGAPFRWLPCLDQFTEMTILAILVFHSFVLITGLIDSDMSLFQLRIFEFPPVPDFDLTLRCMAVYEGNTLLGFQSTLENLSKHVSKLYIEVHTLSGVHFIDYLNTTQVQIQNIIITPYIVIYYPDPVETAPEAEEILLRMISQMPTINFPVNVEVYVAFHLEQKVKSVDKILCDLFGFKSNVTEKGKFCQTLYFNEPMYASEEFFSYNPVSIKRRNLQGSTLNVIGQYDPSYEERLGLVEYENGTVKYTKGMCLDILLALQVSMNFSYVSKKGNGWAGLFPNGSWTGMSAQLIYNEADLSIAQASFVMMIDQLHGISFLQPSALGQFVALFRQPYSSINLLTSVMPRKGWILAGVAWTIVLASVYLVAGIYKRREMISKRDIAFSGEVILWALTTACQKGHNVQPTSLCLRLICLVASFLAICIYVACSAKLTGNLATQEVAIKSFQDLARSRLEVYTDKWLPVARSLIEKIYNQRGVQIPVDNSRLYTIDDGLPRVMFEKTPMAFVTFADAVTSIYYRLNRSDNFFCDTVSSVKVAAAKTPAGMFVKKGSPLKEILNYNILMMAESGILNRLNRQYDDKTQIKCQPEGSFYRGGLYLRDLQTSFQILIGGVALTISMFVCEKFISIAQRCKFSKNEVK